MKRPRFLWLALGLMIALGLVMAAALAGAAGPGDTEEILADQNDDPVPIPPQAAPTIDCPAGTTPAALYFSDLEADDGGWVESGFGDWEWGEVVTGVYEGCDSVPRPEPAGPYSPVNVLGTNLNGCYANSNADNVLTQSFDFSALSAPIELDWWHWYEVFETFDWAIVEVNDTQVWRTPSSAATVDWTQEVVDLSTYAGNPNVTVEFLLHATTVVNRMGWYLDDIAINYCEPAEPAIVLTKTVGLDPGACATGDNITVDPGTEVTYCYEVTNTGNIALTLHDLSDSDLGNILNAFPYTLTQGASAFVTQTAVISTTTVNSATWTAYNPGPSDVVSATAAATVTVEDYEIYLPMVFLDGPTAQAAVAQAAALPMLVGGLVFGGLLMRRKW